MGLELDLAGYKRLAILLGFVFFFLNDGIFKRSTEGLMDLPETRLQHSPGWSLRSRPNSGFDTQTLDLAR